LEEREREARKVRRIDEKRRKVNKKAKEGSKRQENIEKYRKKKGIKNSNEINEKIQ
jgi:hypothetical protein